MNPVIVAIVVDGTLVTGSMPAVLQGNVVMAPLDPYVGALATRITASAESASIVIDRNGKSLTLVLGSRTARENSRPAELPIAPYLRAGTVIIPLADTARALGATAAYDARTRTLTLGLPEAPLATLAPVTQPTPGPAGPTFAPTSTPAPAPTVSGIPKPRRTPIPIASDGVRDQTGN